VFAESNLNLETDIYRKPPRPTQPPTSYRITQWNIK